MKDIETILAAVKRGAKRYFPEQLRLLEAFCGIDCGTGKVEGNARVVSLIDGVLDGMGAQVTHIEAPGYGHHILARFVPAHAAGKLILNAHLDTAFFGERDLVRDHPFHIDGEYACGLGICDCKGGVVTILYALRSLLDAGLMPKRELCVLFNCDEEIGSPTSTPLFAREARNADAILVFEPGRNRNGILTSRRGIAFGSIEVTGVSAHAGFDGGVTGASATRELANLILKLTDRSDPETGLNYNVAPISGGTNAAMVADSARAEFCAFLGTDALVERVREDVESYLPTQGIVDGCTFTARIDRICRPMFRENNLKLYERIRAAGELLGQTLPEEHSSNSGDCNYWAESGVPTVDGLGPYMIGIHTVNERMKLSTLPERTELLTTFLALEE